MCVCFLCVSLQCTCVGGLCFCLCNLIKTFMCGLCFRCVHVYFLYVCFLCVCACVLACVSFEAFGPPVDKRLCAGGGSQLAASCYIIAAFSSYEANIIES